MKAVVMVGGKGTRLRPYSYVMPKPMVPLGKYPVLEIAVRQLEKNGIDEVIFSLGYMGHVIKSFFGDGERFNVKFVYSEEKEALGTAGHLSLLRDKLNDTFLIMNGDILADIDFEELLKRHKESKATVTAVIQKQLNQLQYGVVTVTHDGKIVDYIEKPTQESMATIGMYLMEPKVLEYVEDKKHLDMPELIMKLVKAGEPVQSYELKGTWLHLTKPGDVEKASENWKEIIKEMKLDDVMDTSD
jgi:NDP-sugar pyrophosphorylase family protein